ncbi:MAG: alpha/beta fold hydrolase [Kordiimonas sp.]
MTRVKFILGAIIVVISLTLFKYWTPDIPRETLVNKYATGASDFIDLPSGARAHYRIQGNDEGPILLLLHGSNASLHTWEGWVDILEDDYLVVSVDLPGHGLTGITPSDDYTYSGMAAFIHEFTTTLSFQKYYLVGNSMGGAVSMQYALTYPNEVMGLILIDSAGINTPASALNKVDHPLAFKLAGNWYSSWIVEYITPWEIAAEGLSKSMADTTYLNETLIDRYWELALHPGNRYATNKRFKWYRNNRQELAIENLNVPTLIMWGEQDVVIPLDVGEELHKRIDNSKLKIFKDLGHIPMEENPKKTAKAADNFLATIHKQ